MSYQKFENLLKSTKKTAYKVATDTGISPSTFADWKKGRSTPKADKLKILADEMREKNIIGEAIHFFHSPRHPLKLWKMNIRGLLEDSSIAVDKSGNITLSGGSND